MPLTRYVSLNFEICNLKSNRIWSCNTLESGWLDTSQHKFPGSDKTPKGAFSLTATETIPHYGLRKSPHSTRCATPLIQNSTNLDRKVDEYSSRKAVVAAVIKFRREENNPLPAPL